MKKCRKALCIALTLSLLAFLPASIAAQAEPAATMPMLASGSSHILALKEDGSVWGWGYNTNGVLGLGKIDGAHPSKITTPMQVINSNLSNAVAIASRDWHSLGLQADGSVWAWGINNGGQLGIGTLDPYTTPMRVQNISDITAIAAGRWHSLALKDDGTVYVWGENEDSQLGDGTTIDRYTPVQVPGLSGITALAAGERHSVALKADGTVWAWGNNNTGAVGDGTNTGRQTPTQVLGLSDVIAIAAGYYHTLALKSDGTVWSWGFNFYGQLGDGSNTIRYIPVQVQGLSSVKALAAGEMHTVVVKDDGSAWGFGFNQYGQLGDGSNTHRNVPVKMQGIDQAIAVTAGASHSGVLRSDGTVWVTGGTSFAQLGNGTTVGSKVPVQVLGSGGVGYLNLLSNPPVEVAAESVSIAGESAYQLLVHDTLSLTATVAPETASNQSVAWTSSEPAVAAIDADGNLKAIAEGETVITATTASGGHSAAVTVQVRAVRVTGVSIAGDAEILTIPGYTGELYLTASTVPADASNQAMTWSSSDETIVKVTQTGTIMPQKLGRATVTVTSEDGGFTASVEIIVRVPVQYVVIEGDKFLTLKLGREHQLSYHVLPETAVITDVTWRSTDESVVTVDQTGLVKAIAPGTAVIVVNSRDSNRSTSLSITVTELVAQPYFSEGNSTTVRYKGSKTLGIISSADISSWASDNREVLTVDQHGTITGLRRGTARVIAIGSNGSAEISVTVEYVWWQWLIVIFLFGWLWY